MREDKWFTAEACGENNSCVEVKFNSDQSVSVRNSNEPQGGTLNFTPQEWKDFIGGAKLGEFDLPI